MIVKGTFTSAYDHYEYECEWEGRELVDKADNFNVPDLYYVVVDKVTITSCYDNREECHTSDWPCNLDEDAERTAQGHADNGDFSYVRNVVEDSEEDSEEEEY